MFQSIQKIKFHFVSYSVFFLLSVLLNAPLAFSDARTDGTNDGYPDGGREAQVRAPDEGARAGRDAGYRAGYNQCEREERERQYQRGLREGYTQGEYEGETDGRRQGQVDGERDGSRDGKRDGDSRANSDALRDATPPGRAKGIEEANQSDAAERGFADGLLAGDREAREKALAIDYPRGRNDYRNERYAEPVESEDEFSQHGVLPAFGELQSTHLLDHASPLAPYTNPDFRYNNPRRSYPTPEENQAYQNGYREGYIRGFRTYYGTSYDSAYNNAYRQYWDRGCLDAKNQNYYADYQRGFQDGKRQGYSNAYQRAYGEAYRPVYEQNFRAASEQTYRQTYPTYYDKHFEAARAKAYAERYQERYNESHERARKQKFDEMYPQYAAQEYSRGRADEAEDFRLRPARLLQVQVIESIPNGLHEPGESLRFRVQLRNFAETSLTGRDIRVQLQALDAGSAVITEAEATLVQDLKRKSKTGVRNLLEFRLNESVVDQVSRFRLQVFYQGKEIGTEDFQLSAQFVARLKLARPPELSEGIPTPIAFKVKNQSNSKTDAGFKLRLKSDPTLIEVLNPEVQVGILNPGEERTVSFKVIARQNVTQLKLPIALEGLEGSGRRIGLFDQTEQVPVLNDYKINLQTDLAALRKEGVVRADYTIRNVNSRFILKGLQLLIRVKGENEKFSGQKTLTPMAPEGLAARMADNQGDFAVLGPNPQFLNPMVRNQTLSFLVPVLVKSQNSGGILELEVQEDGRVVVIHQAHF